MCEKISILFLTLISVTVYTTIKAQSFNDDGLDGMAMMPNSNTNGGDGGEKRPDFVGNRIMGGDQVRDISNFCYQVGIKVKVGDQYGWCGGSIISDRTVLTAAHCLKSDLFNITGGTLYFGVLNRDAPEPGSLQINFNTSDFIAHDMWDNTLKLNDIALINLNKSLPFSDRICLIDLVKHKDAKNNFVNETVLISGWGRSSDEYDNYENILRYAEVEIMALEECRQKLWQARPTNICVKSDDFIGACKGDSGGPLVYSSDYSYDKSNRRLIGITSFTSRGCMHKYPRVYTKVGYYLGWICKHSRVCEIIFPDK